MNVKLRVLFLSAIIASAAIFAIATDVGACSVPVYRYALERWAADPYAAVIYHKGELTEAQQALLARRGGEYFLCAVDGQTLDVGTPAGYAVAQAAMAGEQPIGPGPPSGRDM